MAESLAGVALERGLELVVRKLDRGERLKAEDLAPFTIAVVRDLKRRIDEVYAQLSARIDALAESVERRFEETNKRIDALSDSLNRRIDETNKRIDGVYALLGDLQKSMVEVSRVFAELYKAVLEIQSRPAAMERSAGKPGGS